MSDYYVLDDLKRDELGEWENAAWVLDDWLRRCHGILASSSHNLGLLLDLLDEAGYEVRKTNTGEGQADG